MMLLLVLRVSSKLPLANDQTGSSITLYHLWCPDCDRLFGDFTNGSLIDTFSFMLDGDCIKIYWLSALSGVWWHFFFIKVDHIVKLSHLLPRCCFHCPLLLQSISQLLLDSVLVSVACLLGPESPVNKLKIMIMVKIVVIILILRLMLLIRPGDHFVWYPLSLLEQLTKAGSETRAGSGRWSL